MLFRAKDSMTWPTAEGRIAESSIAYSPGGDRLPYIDLEYVFTVGGKVYSGDTVVLSEHPSSSFADMKKTVNKYPKDKAVSVRYLPTNPSVCVLEPGIHFEVLLYPASGLFFIAAAIVLPILLRRIIPISRRIANKPAAPNAGVASQLTTEHPRSGVDEPGH